MCAFLKHPHPWLCNLPCNSFGFEMSQRQGVLRRDISLCVYGPNLTTLLEKIRTVPTPDKSRPWVDLELLLLNSIESNIPLRVWLEFDAGELESSLPTPSIFFGSAEGAITESFLRMNGVQRIISKHELNSHGFHEKVEASCCYYIGKMYSRQPESVRFTCTVQNVSAVNKLLKPFDLQCPDEYSVLPSLHSLRAAYCSVDLTHTASGAYALELMPERDYSPEHLLSWMQELEGETGIPFSQRLRRKSPSACHMKSTVATLGVNPQEWSCRVSHIKLQVQSSQLTEIKPYFLFHRSGG